MSATSNAFTRGDREVSMQTITDSLLPPVGADFVRNLLYTVGFMRVLGELEGAAAVDRQGKGKVYARGDARADETIAYFDEWSVWGARSDLTAASVERVRKIHAAYGKRYSMSPETFIHTVAFFTLQIGIILKIVGAPMFSDSERRAQVEHWRRIGELLAVENMPTTWEGMELALQQYESDPRWFGYTPAAKQSSDALIEQFTRQWFPRGFRRVGKSVVLSLHEPHVLVALGQQRPSVVASWVTRRAVRAGLYISRRLPAPLPVDRTPSA